ncbi:hypothetical protein HNQ07_003679 [Deinococcus metalli]|uniref:DUF5709 domain-containing protein n=1 Tax=Deinococcus metalli TaxID=1141878 RepID=A0A7W8KI32_9DEIO|nr:hypothetical protein [Deinococcus metalli]MBB5378178.1 hypothetical protein [Deinococcus metalli]GHF56619.1 hypothetical protein GCM10017781_36170 [Deinococcus metalli]
MTDPINPDPTTDSDPELAVRLGDDATATSENIDRDGQEPSDEALRPSGGLSAGATTDYSLPETDDPANQDVQSNAELIRAVEGTEDDFPVSGDVTGGHRGSPGSDALAGAGIAYDDGIDPSLRSEMLDNAVAYGDDFVPNNVNDEPSFDDGVPGSFSDFSVITPENPDGTTRLADPSLDAGGEVKGPRVGGSGVIDGGPPRTTPLPGSKDEE